jgi:hypothetical protein
VSSPDSTSTPRPPETAANSEAHRSTVSPPSTPEEEPQPSPSDEQPSPPTGEEEKPPPYNRDVAYASLGGAVGVFLIVLAASFWSGLIKTPADFATVSAAMGGLFTLIGTVAGAYFGIKSSSDAADRAKKQVDEARKQVDEANVRTERANRNAKAALLEVDPTYKGKEFRDRALL